LGTHANQQSTTHHEAVEPELLRSSSEERAACDALIGGRVVLPANASWLIAAQNTLVIDAVEPGQTGCAAHM
jgi:hypothetical protein